MSIAEPADTGTPRLGLRAASRHGGPHTGRPSAKILPEHARAHNRSLVLQTLYRRGPLSRADVARETGLTRVTISDLVSELLGEQLVLELGQREDARPGKPATLLDIHRTGFQIVALDLSEHDRFRGALLDLDGTILHREEVPLAGARGDAALELVVALAERVVAAAERPILGIGVGSPGVVDLAGVVITSANLGWEQLPLQSILAERTQLPTQVANDANAAVLAERSFGDGASDLMLVKIGHGLGSGLMIGGALVYGSRFAAGELGQVMVGTDHGLDIPYDRESNLESWLAVPRLGARRDAALAAGETVEPLLREAGQRLGVALAPVVGALNLSDVVLSGPTDLLDGLLAEAAIDTIRKRTMADSHGHLTLRMTALGEDIVLLGAVVLVLAGRLGVS